MKGDRALGTALLVLAAVVAPPALSAAQEPSPAEPAAEPIESTPPAPPETTGAAQPEQADAGQSPPPQRSNGDSNEPAAPVVAATTTPAPVPAPAPAEPAAQSRSAGSPKAKLAASALVSVGDNFYSPATVSIAVGDTVTWRNNGQAPHSATADNGSFDTGVFDPGQSRSNTFSQAGTFSYFCTVHGQAQSGTVRVASAGGSGGSDDAAASGTGTDTSEADAVASAGAEGSDNFLPATGFAIAGLLAAGFALLGGGIALRPYGEGEPDERA